MATLAALPVPGLSVLGTKVMLTACAEAEKASIAIIDRRAFHPALLPNRRQLKNIIDLPLPPKPRNTSPGEYVAS
jgi:hypothetical protein